MPNVIYDDNGIDDQNPGNAIEDEQKENVMDDMIILMYMYNMTKMDWPIITGDMLPERSSFWPKPTKKDKLQWNGEFVFFEGEHGERRLDTECWSNFTRVQEYSPNIAIECQNGTAVVIGTPCAKSCLKDTARFSFYPGVGVIDMNNPKTQIWVNELQRQCNARNTEIQCNRVNDRNMVPVWENGGELMQVKCVWDNFNQNCRNEIFNINLDVFPAKSELTKNEKERQVFQRNGIETTWLCSEVVGDYWRKPGQYAGLLFASCVDGKLTVTSTCKRVCKEVGWHFDFWKQEALLASEEKDPKDPFGFYSDKESETQIYISPNLKKYYLDLDVVYTPCEATNPYARGAGVYRNCDDGTLRYNATASNCTLDCQPFSFRENGLIMDVYDTILHSTEQTLACPDDCSQMYVTGAQSAETTRC